MDIKFNVLISGAVLW